jgi:hypothetical protein
LRTTKSAAPGYFWSRRKADRARLCIRLTPLPPQLDRTPRPAKRTASADHAYTHRPPRLVARAPCAFGSLGAFPATTPLASPRCTRRTCRLGVLKSPHQIVDCRDDGGDGLARPCRNLGQVAALISARNLERGSLLATLMGDSCHSNRSMRQGRIVGCRQSRPPQAATTRAQSFRMELPLQVFGGA